MPNAVTVVGSVVELAAAAPNAPLVLEKRFGKWTSRPRCEIVEHVTELAFAVRELGLRSDDVALVMLQSHTSWIVTDLAMQAAGLRVAAIAATSESDLVGRVLADSGARIVFVQDQRGADAVLGAMQARSLPALDHVIYVDPAGVAEYPNEILMALADLRDRGHRAAEGHTFDEFLVDRHGDDVAVVSYSHGVTGPPRASLLTHRALMSGALATADVLQLGESDRVMAVRPLSDAVERGATLYPALVAGSLVVLPENAATIAQAAWETAPTSVHLTLRHLKTMAAQIRVRMQSTRGLKGLVARRWNRRFVAAVEKGAVSPPSGPWRWLVGYPILEKLGLNQVRRVVVSGDHVPPEAIQFFRALGLDLAPGYALSQMGGLVALDRDGTGTGVGRALQGIDVRIAHDGEILLRGESAALLGGDGSSSDAEGWLHTGDIGSLADDGTLVVSHRRGEELDLGEGRRVSASLIEAELRASPYIKDAVLESRAGRTWLVVELMQVTVERWASHRRILFATFRSLAATAEVRELVERAVNEATDRHEGLTIDELVILNRDLDQVPGSLSPTGKARRERVLELADALQASGDPSGALPHGSAPAR